MKTKTFCYFQLYKLVFFFKSEDLKAYINENQREFIQTEKER